MRVEPPRYVLDWIRRRVPWSSEIRTIRLLPGATSSSLFELEAAGSRRSTRLVLRLIDNPEWLEESPDIARQEASALQRAAPLAVPVPELVAFDEDGSSTGVPAVLMSKLEGRVELGNREMNRWLSRLAEALVAVHGVDPTGFSWGYDPWYDASTIRPPRWTRCPARWEKAIALVAGETPPSKDAFLHRDYHPTNVLWKAGEISGIVDWPNACIGPPSADIAHCRVNLTALHGPSVARAFLDAYQSFAGRGFTYDPYWDLNSLIDVSRGPQLYEPWLLFGADLTEQLVCSRQDDLLEKALAELSP